MAQRFSRLDFGTIPTKIINGSRCILSQICSPYTLPFVDKDIPLCENEFDRACYEEILMELESNQENDCQKLCHTKEYQTEVGQSKYQSCSANETCSMSFRYQFEVPQAIRDYRSRKPFKTIKREFLIMDGISLVRNVGGTLGVFVGFSFIGAAEWLLEITEKLKSWVKQRKTNSV